jgi:hypothetical protein
MTRVVYQCRPAIAAAAAVLAGHTHAQTWMERFERHPSPEATLALVDIADGGVALGQYTFRFGSTLVDTGFLWTKASNLQLIASASRWTVSSLSPDGTVAFGSSIPAGTVTSFRVGNAGTSSSPVVGRVLSTTQNGSEGFGSFAGSPRTPLVFNRTNPATSSTLATPVLPGHDVRDVEISASVASGARVFGNAKYIRTSDGASVTRAAAWNRDQAGTPVLLATPFGNSSCLINAASADGAWGAGAALTANGTTQPWLYVASVNAWAPLPPVGNDVSGEALDIAAAGTTLVGNARGPGSPADRGRVWCNALTFSGRSVESLLLSRGIDLSHWTGLSLRRISPDGRFLIGDGFYDGVENSWIAFVGLTCCPSDLNDDGASDLDDFFAFFNCWDATAPCADIDANPGVNLDDFFAFFNAFDAGC